MREWITARNQILVLLTDWDDSSLVIDRLCDEIGEEDTAVACFYFDFASRNEQSPVNMLGSLLRQLVSGLDGIPEAVVRRFRNEKKAIGGRGLQVSGILKMFQTITTTKRTFICVDALDECVPEHRMVILESLGQIVKGSLGARIFLTGRSHVRSEVERKFDGAAAFILIEPTGDGITMYLREKLKNDTAPEMMSRALEAGIMESIPEISSETYVDHGKAMQSCRWPMADILKCRFLLASLHIEAILRETSIARRGKRLKSVKDGAGLGDAFGATLERIKAQGGEKTKLAMATLMWICHAERPLQVDELRHALAVEIGSTHFDSENASSISALLGCCQGLITVDKEALTVRLIHFTVQEYLCAHPDLFSQPHTVIAETCLTYLNSQQVKNLSSRSLPDHQIMPFLSYSSRYWGTHANRELSDHARALALDLLNQYEDHLSAISIWKQILRPGYVGDADASPRFSGLHCASFFGIRKLVTALLNAKGCAINRGDCGGNTPLLWAAKNGHDEVVELLLCRKDIDPDRPDNKSDSPLSWAAENGHEGVVRLLLERDDVDPNRPDENDRTPLGCASSRGNEGVAKLLLGREGTDPNRPDKSGFTPLALAAHKGHEGIVKLLLERDGVEPDRPDNGGSTPLLWAANNGHEEIVKLLLGRKDVDPNRPENNNQTPLRCAACEGHERAVRLLLGREDVNPNTPDEDGFTPLAVAAHKGHEGIVKLLLGRKDVDPNRPNNDNQTPLRCAAREGHERAVRLLLEREDVNPNTPDEDGFTPLAVAAEKGHEGIVKLLLEREGLDLDRPDIQGRTPLFWAANNGHEGVVKLLLDQKDVDPNRPNNINETPLGRAIVNGHESVVKLLQARISSVKSVDAQPPY